MLLATSSPLILYVSFLIASRMASTLSFSFPIASWAIRSLCVPSNANGRVTTAIVRAPLCLATSAMTGEAPEPVVEREHEGTRRPFAARVPGEHLVERQRPPAARAEVLHLPPEQRRRGGDRRATVVEGVVGQDWKATGDGRLSAVALRRTTSSMISKYLWRCGSSFQSLR